MFLELNLIPFPNKYPSKELNTFPYKELNMLLKKKLNISLNLDKSKELNMMKLNTKYKDLKLSNNNLLFNKLNTFNNL